VARLVRTAVVLLVVPWLACGENSGVTAPSASREVLSLSLETPRFRLFASRATASTLGAIGDRLETKAPRFARDLGLAAIDVTRVEVWSDAESFYADMQASIGQRYDGASGYVKGPATLSILDGGNAPGRAAHELVHCLSLRVNPTIANNPRWLWETVAVYENGELVDPRTLSYLRAGGWPTLEQLNADHAASHQVYEVGYLIGDFVVSVWGQEALVRLIQANGDVERVLGTSAAEFERQWRAFVEARYL
jgi:hypothetical protein